MSAPGPTADFYPTGGAIPFEATTAARVLGYESAMLLESARERIRMGAGERHHRVEALVRAGDTLIAARCGSVVFFFLESLHLGLEDNAAARDLRAAIPAAWHKLYADNAPHIAASRGYK